jgi:hypothetical protein
MGVNAAGVNAACAHCSCLWFSLSLIPLLLSHSRRVGEVRGGQCEWWEDWTPCGVNPPVGACVEPATCLLTSAA